MRFRGVLFILLATTGAARADLTSRALDTIDEGGGTKNNLIAWAGVAKQTTLPERLQLAVRFAPALQSPKLDIEIAEAQIQETWERRDWIVNGQVAGSWSQAGVLGGVTIGSSKRFSTTAGISRVIETGATI